MNAPLDKRQLGVSAPEPDSRAQDWPGHVWPYQVDFWQLLETEREVIGQLSEGLEGARQVRDKAYEQSFSLLYSQPVAVSTGNSDSIAILDALPETLKQSPSSESASLAQRRKTFV